jgi:acetyl-CoA acetyltransferase
VTNGLRGATAIAGIGQTEFSKNSGRSELQLTAEATLAALDDAGLTTADVDGMVTFTIDPTEDNDLMRTLGIDALGYSGRVPHGGGAAAGTILHAASAIHAGAAEVVVCYRALNARSGRRFGRARATTEEPVRGTGWSHTNWMLPFGVMSPMATLALNVLPWMERYGLTNRDFGEYSVVIRDYASRNPNAWFYEKPITIEDHQASRWIVEPILRLLDCCQESDGGVAVVVTSAARARDCRHGGMVVMGAAQAIGERNMADTLYRVSGMGPDDIQAAMIYDAMSPAVFMALERLGFVEPGGANDFIAGGETRIDGRLPVNTNGGLIGEAYIHGMNLITEAVRQLRGTAVNQVSDVERVLVSSGICGHILSRP